MMNDGDGLRCDMAVGGVICRLCMKIHECTQNIFVSKAAHGMAIWNVLQDLLNVQVAEGDGLPDTACHRCVSKLLEFSEFKEMCLKSATELKTGALGSHLKVDVKEEIDPIELLPEVETGRQENHGESELRERANYEVFCEPLAMEDEIDLKEEIDHWQSPAINDISSGVHLAEQEPGEDAFVPESMNDDSLHQNSCVKEEVVYGEILVMEDNEIIGNLAENESQLNTTSSEVSMPPEVENMSCVKEEVVYGEILTTKDTERKGNLAENESQLNTTSSEVSMPLGVKNMLI